MMNIISTFILLVLLGYASTETVSKRSNVCYGALGCFSNGGMFQKGQRLVSVTPLSPESIKTKFILFTRDNRENGNTIAATDLSNITNKWNLYSGDRPTKYIIHGFVDSWQITTWMTDLKNQMLIYGDYNVILVDWNGGGLNLYAQATANTRVVGAQIALLTQKLMAIYNMSADSVHAIGHSLGAHVAGYAGERIPGFGRISGLDAAGPYFEGMDKSVRLDPSDAQFVDAIHTDSKGYLIGYGIKQAVGHVDFFPNDGSHQPGCSRSVLTKILNNGLFKGAVETVACNHLRVLKFYVESVNSKCPFLAHPCKNADDFHNNKCLSCGDGCSRMGFHADKYKPAQRTNFYLRTSADSPFCEYNIAVKIFLAPQSSKERGHLQIKINGETGQTGMIRLNDLPRYLNPGEEMDFLVSVPSDIGRVTYADMSWIHRSNLFNPFSWNLLNLRGPRIIVKQIDIKRDEAADVLHLCTNGEEIENGKVLKVINRCPA